MSPMGDYRIYRLDRANHVVDVDYVSAATDDEAMRAARAMKAPGVREVWQGDRLVGTITVEVADGPSAGFWL